MATSVAACHGMPPSAKLKSGCAFCEILQGTAKCFKVTEDEWTLTFLDERPLFPGHCLLIPKSHIETLIDLPEPLVTPLFTNVRFLSQAIQVAMQAEGSLVLINNRVSQSVPHLHVHIVPRRKGDGLRGFLWPRRQYADEAEIGQVLQKLRAAIVRLQGIRVRAHNSKSEKG